MFFFLAVYFALYTYSFHSAYINEIDLLVSEKVENEPVIMEQDEPLPHYDVVCHHLKLQYPGWIGRRDPVK